MKTRHEFDSDSEYNAYLRIYFAAMAMQGLLSIYDGSTVVPNQANTEYMAKVSVSAADSLLAELEKQPHA